MRARSTPSMVGSDDRGLLLGDGVFETVRLYGGRPVFLERHLARMEVGARTLGIPIPEKLRSRVGEAMRGWDGEDAALRITLTRGPGAGLAPPPDPRPELIVSVRGWSEDPGVLQRGLSARLHGRVDEQALVVGVKAIGYTERIQALRMARLAGADEALIRNSRGRVVEGSASNVLAVAGGDTLLAPGPEEGALAGITRELLLEIAEDLGLRSDPRGLEPSELEEVSELLLSSSLRGVVPVTEIEGRAVGTGRPGPIFRALRQGLGERVGRLLRE